MGAKLIRLCLKRKNIFKKMPEQPFSRKFSQRLFPREIQAKSNKILNFFFQISRGDLEPQAFHFLEIFCQEKKRHESSNLLFFQ